MKLMSKGRAVATTVVTMLILASSAILGQEGRVTGVLGGNQPTPGVGIAAPGSPAAKRLARERVLVNKGLIPVTIIGSSEPPEIPFNPQYVGTRIIVNPDATGNQKALQKTLAAAFNKLDPCPNSRPAHFQWLPRFDHVRHLGWSGQVIAAESRQDGSYLMKIQIRPYLASPIMKTSIIDYVEETYVYALGRMQLVATDAEVAKPRLRVFPIGS